MLNKNITVFMILMCIMISGFIQAQRYIKPIDYTYQNKDQLQPFESDQQSVFIKKDVLYMKKEGPRDVISNLNFLYLYNRGKKEVSPKMRLGVQIYTNSPRIYYQIHGKDLDLNKWTLTPSKDLFHWFDQRYLYRLNHEFSHCINDKWNTIPVRTVGLFSLIVDLYHPDSKRPPKKTLYKYNQHLYQTIYKLLSKEDFNQCINESLIRYEKAAKTYLEKYPSEKVPEYTSEEIIEAISNHLKIEELNYYAYLIGNEVDIGGIQWKKLYKSIHQSTLKDNKQSITCTACKTVNFIGNEFCTQCGAPLSDYNNPSNKGSHFYMPRGKLPTNWQLNPSLKKNSKYYETDIEKTILENRLAKAPAVYPMHPSMPTTHGTTTTPEKPKLTFNERISYPIASYLNPLGNLITEFPIPQVKRILLNASFLSDQQVVLFDYNLWKDLNEKEQFEMKKFAFNNHILILYHAPENRQSPIGTGGFIMMEKGYWEDKTLLHALKTFPEQTFKLNPIKTLTKRNQELTRRFHFLSFLYILFAVIFCFLWCIKTKKFTSLLYLIPINSIVFSIIVYFTFQGIFTHEPVISDVTISLLDQHHQLKKEQVYLHYHQSTNRKQPFALSSDYAYEYRENFDDAHNGYRYVPREYHIDHNTMRFQANSYDTGFLTKINANKTIASSEKILCNWDQKTIINQLNHTIERIYINKDGKGYFARNIEPGKTAIISLCTNSFEKDQTGLYRLFEKTLKTENLKQFIETKKTPGYYAELAPSKEIFLQKPYLRKSPIHLLIGFMEEEVK